MKTIGLFGLTFDSGNLGCCALAYAFANILSGFSNEIGLIYVFGNGVLVKDDMNLPMKVVNINWKSPISLCNIRKKISECDVVFDFTEGDSFSDIYGMKRFIKVSFTKVMCIHSNTYLVMGPQTYGPYESYFSKKVASYILKRADYVMSRDAVSSELVANITGRKAECYTDIAFALPYKKHTSKSENRKIGINISGLLWRGGYSGKNQFGLKTDYKEYIERIIDWCLCKDFEVYLISHVITKDETNPENDYTAAKEVKKMFPKTCLAPKFASPIEAKSYISDMDVFIGARMHATIGAFSSGVCTIPFSYSKKFEGLYNSLGYPFVIHGLEMSTREAVSRTISYLENTKMLCESQKVAMKNCDENLEIFSGRIKDIIEGEL